MHARQPRQLFPVLVFFQTNLALCQVLVLPGIVCVRRQELHQLLRLGLVGAEWIRFRVFAGGPGQRPIAARAIRPDNESKLKRTRLG